MGKGEEWVGKGEGEERDGRWEKSGWRERDQGVRGGQEERCRHRGRDSSRGGRWVTSWQKEILISGRHAHYLDCSFGFMDVHLPNVTRLDTVNLCALLCVALS